MHVEISNLWKAFAKWDFRGPRCSFRLKWPCNFEGEDMSRSSKDRIYDLFINQRYAECHSLIRWSNGSISADLGDMWHHGYPVSPRWREDWNWISQVTVTTQTSEVGTSAAQDHAAESGPKDYISVVRDSSRSPYISYFDEVHSPHNSIWDLPEAIEGGPFAPCECHRN